jgi:hypothetical protein
MHELRPVVVALDLEGIRQFSRGGGKDIVVGIICRGTFKNLVHRYEYLRLESRKRFSVVELDFSELALAFLWVGLGLDFVCREDAKGEYGGEGRLRSIRCYTILKSAG